MKVAVALGGNALLKRGEPLTAENQARNIRRAARALGALGKDHDLVVVHGSGPQVGLLALQDAAVPEAGNFPLDVLNAQTTGMIGYPVAQALRNELPERQVASILTQIEVDPDDPAFAHPTKPIGPVYTREEAERLARERHWHVAPDGKGWRRVVPSPQPKRILEIETIQLLVDAGVLVLAAGGGGIPVVFDALGRAHGVEAIIDKDPAAALLAMNIGAQALLLLTDTPAVQAGWGTPDARDLFELTVTEARELDLPAGSMGPKVRAAAAFVERTGARAGIGCLEDAAAILEGSAGTRIVPAPVKTG
ncbi:MAG: carbamate kinase [Gemmatimonadota bacterium]